MTLRVIGIDPALAWAILDVTGGKGSRVAHGTLDPAEDLADLEAIVKAHGPALGGVEVVGRVYPRADKGGISANYATELYRSGMAAGEIRRLLKSMLPRVESVTAEEVRKAIIGSVRGGGDGAMDRAIARVLPLRVTGWPAAGKPGVRTSTNHERDAGMAALFVGLRALNPLARAMAGRVSAR